jgi:hypothetical protein
MGRPLVADGGYAAGQTATLELTAGWLWAARAAHPMISHVYDDFLQSLDIGSARRQFQDSMEAEGKPLFGFSWLDACADRDASRELIG